jgi:hypothetical protein
VLSIEDADDAGSTDLPESEPESFEDEIPEDQAP